jgi:SAM-dependent methyltransferase
LTEQPQNPSPSSAGDVKPKARRSIHDTLITWFAQQARGTLLDAPAGYGHLSMNLAELGYEVTAGEVEPEIFAVQGMDCIYTDLNRRIDAPDNRFDYVCCVDGLEHMTDPYTAVAEFARVLKPGGYGVFSIPNYSNIEKRFKFLWHGYLTKSITEAHYDRVGRRLYNLHNSPLTVTLLEFMFRINHLEIENILKNASKKKQYLFYPLVLLMKLEAFFASAETREKRRFDLTLHKNVIFGGSNLIFITRKRS